MTTIRLVLRATVRAPRSVDPTEVAVLTGSGAVHADQFKVATMDGLAGFKGYLEFPSGRRGRIDPKERKTDIGQLTFRIVDKQLTGGGSQAVRWVSGFPGALAGDGRTRWKGCLWETEISTDGGTTFTRWFTGRITSANISGGWADFVVQGLTRDFSRAKVFTQRPHSSIGYVAETSLVPLGITATFASVAPIPALNGTIGAATNGGGTSILVAADSIGHVRNVVTSAFRMNDGRAVLAFRGHGLFTVMSPYPRDGEARVRITAGASNGDVRILGYRMQKRGDGHFALAEIWIEALAVTDAGYIALPANGTAVTWRVQGALRSASKSTPLFLSDVHTMQHAADVIDGKFSDLNADGSIKRAYPRDAGVWATFIADPSWGKVRNKVEEASKALEYLEKLGKVKGFCLREDAQGRLVPVDMRPLKSLAGVLTLTDDDHVAGTKIEWSEDVADAISRFQVKYYLDTNRSTDDLASISDQFPDVSPCLIESAPVDPPYEERAVGSADAGENTLSIDAPWLRASINEVAGANPTDTNINRIDEIEGQCRDLLRSYEKPFVTGAQYLKFTCRRTANPLALEAGSPVLTQFTTQLNPALNQRGGTLLLRILEKTERGGRIDFLAMFMGPGVQAGVPTLGAPAAGADPRHSLTVNVTLNANNDPVTVRVALTATSVGVAPVDTDIKWVNLALAKVAGVVTIRNLPGGYRAWVDGRSSPRTDRTDTALPSAFVLAGGTGYVDLTGITAPVSIVVSNVSALKADLTLNLGGDTINNVRLLLGSGASQALADASVPVALVPDLRPGTLKYTLFGLAGLWYRVQVQLVDGLGGMSAVVGTAPTSFHATGANAVAPALGGVAPLVPNRIMAVKIIAEPEQQPNQPVATGVGFTLIPGMLGFDIAVLEAPDVAGAPGAFADVDIVPAGRIHEEGTVWSRELPADGIQRWYEFEHRAVGYDPGPRTRAYAQIPGPLPREATPLKAQGPIATDRPLAGSARSVLQLQTWLIPNSEMDLFQEDGFTPVGWALDLTGGATVTRILAPNSGDYALRYSNPDNATNGGFHGLSTLDPLKGAFCCPFRPGANYRLLISSKVDSVVNGECFRVTLDFGGGGTLSKVFTYQNLRHVAGVYGALFEYPFTCPAGADPNTRGIIEFSRNGSGAATNFDLDSIRADEETADYARLSQQIQDQGYIVSINGDYERGLANWEEFKGGMSTTTLAMDTGTVDKGNQSLKITVSVSNTQTLIQQSTRDSDEQVTKLDTDASTVRVTRVRSGDRIHLRGSVRIDAAGPVPNIGARYWSGAVATGAGTGVLVATGSAASIGAFEQISGIWVVPNGVSWFAPYLQVDNQAAGRTVWYDDLAWGRLLQPPTAKVYNGTGTNVNLPNNTDTPITFASEEWDDGALHNTAALTNRLTINGTKQGEWRLVGQVNFAAAAGGFRRVRIVKNGAVEVAAQMVPSIGATEMAVQVSVPIKDPAAGDYYELYALQNSGGAINALGGHDAGPPVVPTKTWFAISHVR